MAKGRNRLLPRRPSSSSVRPAIKAGSPRHQRKEPRGRPCRGRIRFIQMHLSCGGHGVYAKPWKVARKEPVDAEAEKNGPREDAPPAEPSMSRPQGAIIFRTQGANSDPSVERASHASTSGGVRIWGANSEFAPPPEVAKNDSKVHLATQHTRRGVTHSLDYVRQGMGVRD